MPITHPDHPVEKAAREAAARLLGLRFHHVVGNPDKADADNLIQDVEALWQIFDPVIHALGRYADECLSNVPREDYTDQVRGALEGNLTFSIQKAFERLCDEQRQMESLGYVS